MSSDIRITAKAVIRRDDKILFIRLQYDDGEFYDLPGGGMEPGETLPQALKRECMEEIGAEVLVRDVLCVYNFIAQKHERTRDLGVHYAVKIAFTCELLGEPGISVSPDDKQVGVVWIPMQELNRYPHHPSNLTEALSGNKTYLGEVL